MLAKVDAKTVSKTNCIVKAKALVNTVPDTISELVAKTIADTLSCVKAKAPVKTESPTFVPVSAYTVVHKLNEVKAEALITQDYKFLQVEAKSVTVTLVERISYTLSVRQ